MRNNSDRNEDGNGATVVLGWRGVNMGDRTIRRAVVFLAVLMYRIVITEKIIRLNDTDFLKLAQLKNRDFSLFE